MDITETKHVTVIQMLPGETEEQLQGQLEEFFGTVGLVYERNGKQMASCFFRSQEWANEFHQVTERYDKGS